MTGQWIAISIEVLHLVMLALSIPLAVHAWRQWRRYRRLYMLSASRLFDRVSIAIMLVMSADLLLHSKAQAGSLDPSQWMIAVTLAVLLVMRILDRTSVLRLAIRFRLNGASWPDAWQLAREIVAAVDDDLCRKQGSRERESKP